MIGKEKPLLGALLSFAAAASFSFEYVLFKLAQAQAPELSSATAVFWGALLTVAVVWPVLLMQPSKRQRVGQFWKKHKRPFLAVVGVSTATFTFGITGLFASNADVTSILEKSHVPFAVLLGILFLGEQLSWKQTFALVLSILGLALITQLPHGEVPLQASIFLIITGFLISVHSFLVKRFLPDNDALIFSALRLPFLVAILAILSLPLGYELFSISWEVILLLGLAVFVGAFLSRWAYYGAHNLLPMSILNLLLLSEVLFSLLGAVLFLGAPLGWQKVLGVLLLLVGLVWTTVATKEN